jgi:hypothetical protein
VTHYALDAENATRASEFGNRRRWASVVNGADMNLGVRFVAGLILALCLGCAYSGGVVDHSFSFNALQDSPDVEVMDFRYGTSQQPGARNEHLERAQGKSAQATGVTGPMLRGEDLYVKWRVKSTGQIYEDTVNLRKHLPPDITGQRIHFLIRGQQLYVFLISNQRRTPNDSAIGPRMYSHLKTTQIYPDAPK